jgi:hypothetical protein
MNTVLNIQRKGVEDMILKKIITLFLVLTSLIGVSCFGVMPMWDIDFESDVTGEHPFFGDYLTGVINLYPSNIKEGGADGSGWSYTGNEINVKQDYIDSVSGNIMVGKSAVWDVNEPDADKVYTLIMAADEDATDSDVIKITWEQMLDTVNGTTFFNIFKDAHNNILRIDARNWGSADPNYPNYGQPDKGHIQVITWETLGDTDPTAYDYPLAFDKGAVLRFKVILDMPNETADVYLNETHAGTYSLPSTGSPWFGTRFSRMFISVPSSADGIFSGAVDNIRILPVPNDCTDVGGVVLGGDMNSDCYVDADDLSELANVWLDCNDPSNPDCVD